MFFLDYLWLLSDDWQDRPVGMFTGTNVIKLFPAVIHERSWLSNDSICLCMNYLVLNEVKQNSVRILSFKAGKLLV